MRYYIFHDERSGTITGHFRSSSDDITPLPRGPYESVAEVTADAEITLLDDFDPHNSRLRGTVDGGLLTALRVEQIYRGSLVVTCDRADLDGDGVPELPADGRSTARIIATLVDDKQKPLQGKDIQVEFRVTRGVLSSRRQIIENEAAEVSVQSTVETTRTLVTATAEGFRQGRLELEFIPPEEYRGLLAAVADSSD